MHAIAARILNEFKRSPGKTYATTEMVKEVFKQEYTVLNEQLNTSDPVSLRKAYVRKAKLHRKLLYHLNQLIEDELLVVAGSRGKGEKLFKLAIEEGEVIIQDKAQRIIIAKPPAISTLIDGDERDGVVSKFEPESWLSKQNSVLIDAAASQSFDALQRRLQSVLPALNDVVAIFNFELLLQRSSYDEAMRFLHSLSLDARDYHVGACLLINTEKIEEEVLLKLLRSVLIGEERPRGIRVIIEATPRIIAHRELFFKELFSLFGQSKKKLTIKNGTLFRPPIFFGRAGAYSIIEDDWTYYNQRIKGRADGCVVGQSSVAVDVARFFNKGGTPSSFRQLLLRCGHALFEIEERRRKYFGNYFANLTLQDREAAKEFYRIGRNYIRVWNYDLQNENYFAELLLSCQEDLNSFCNRQETIFRSCGLPIRFQIGLSTSFAKFDHDFFTERRYKQTMISSLRDLHTAEMKRYLSTRESLHRAFKGADRIRIFFARQLSHEELIKTTRYLLSAYDLPSFTYDFRGKSGEMKLTSFLEDADA